MSIHYIIDGYNVIKQVSFLTGKKLRSGREGLVKFIERYRPQGSSRNAVTLVFDGQADVSSPQLISLIKVIFSKGESADAKIKRMVERSKNPKQIVVVTDDKEIMFYCRSIGATVSSVRAFINNSYRAKKSECVEEQEDKPELDSAIAMRITEDLKKLWVKDVEKESLY
ncbi:MAG: NYN domain-containing protein [Candidatus Omnitrophica bacterium]|nr:NYN domain-containing protein [Candidatus Omnitrophota bacterium]